MFTGPRAQAIEHALVEAAKPGSGALWLVETGRLKRSLERRLGDSARVRTWAELWEWVAKTSRGATAPAPLSSAGRAAALDVAIAQARSEDRLGRLERIAETSGFRDRLLDRFDQWTRNETPPAGDRDGRRALYELYRAVLSAHDLEDSAGLEVRSSRALAQSRSAPKGVHELVVLADTHWTKAKLRAVKALEPRLSSITIALEKPDEPELAALFARSQQLLAYFLAQGYDHVTLAREPGRPAGLAAIETRLFREDDRGTEAAVPAASGVAIVGAPEGEGEAAVVARTALDLIEAGASPEEILILRRGDPGNADLVVETLRAWGISVAPAKSAPIASEPEIVAAFLLAQVPLDDWDAETLVRVLRHSVVSARLGRRDRLFECEIAAAAIRDLGVLGGLPALRARLAALAEPASEPARSSDQRTRARAAIALEVLDRLGALLGPMGADATWDGHASGLAKLIRELSRNREPGGAPALFAGALDEHVRVRELAGESSRLLSHSEFLIHARRLAQRTVREATLESPSRPAVLVATPAEARGLAAKHVIAIGLNEGSFPDRKALRRSRAVGPADDERNTGFEREMALFLSLVGMAETSITFTYANLDNKGRGLLEAGFLEEVERLFASPTSGARKFAREISPSPVPAEEYCVTPALVRVRAVAMALEGESGPLARLARDPKHREALVGAGLAMLAMHARGSPRYTRYDGMFRDRRAVAALADRFGPDRAMSPSQLETYAFCPHQFFMKHVLKIDAPRERDLLDIDHAARGSLFHRVVELTLQEINRVVAEDRATLSEMIELKIDGAIATALGERPPATTELEQGLAEIADADLRAIAQRFVGQARKFDESEPQGLWPEFAEWNFGEAGSKAGALVLGAGDQRVELRGRVDRVDVSQGPGGIRFRVIDYKTGRGHSAKDFDHGLALQLPLYAMAFEDWLRTAKNDEARPVGFGYWSLKAKGYASLYQDGEAGGAKGTKSGRRRESWEETSRAFERYVLELAHRLRSGAFPVRSRSKTCTSACDYSSTCRIVQMRRAGKTWPEEPTLRLGDEP